MPIRDRGRPHGLPLPHQRTNGSRIRRFGRGSHRTPVPLRGRQEPERPLLSRQREFHPIWAYARRMHYPRSLASDDASPSIPAKGNRPGLQLQTLRLQHIGWLHLSVQSASLASPVLHLLCPLQTSAPRSGKISLPPASFSRTRDPRAGSHVELRRLRGFSRRSPRTKGLEVLALTLHPPPHCSTNSNDLDHRRPPPEPAPCLRQIGRMVRTRFRSDA